MDERAGTIHKSKLSKQKLRRENPAQFLFASLINDFRKFYNGSAA
jgi:hypothetical protein